MELGVHAVRSGPDGAEHQQDHDHGEDEVRLPAHKCIDPERLGYDEQDAGDIEGRHRMTPHAGQGSTALPVVDVRTHGRLVKGRPAVVEVASLGRTYVCVTCKVAPVTVLQLGLFSAGDVAVTGGAVAERTPLGDGAWVDMARGWLAGADSLFSRLVGSVPWRHYKRWMYDRVVDDPRMSHWCRDAAELGEPSLSEVQRALERLYHRPLAGPGLNYYRDGRDSVAFHSDRELRHLDDTLVAIVTLGATRRFLVRPKGSGRSVDFRPASGDLLVMGGTCQAHFEHSVPKSASVKGGRISASWRWSRRDVASLRGDAPAQWYRLS